MTVPKRRDGNHAVRQHLAPNSRKATVKPKGRSNLAKARCAHVHGLGQADRIMYRVECPGRQRLGVVVAATIASACITQSSISCFVMPLAALAERSSFERLNQPLGGSLVPANFRRYYPRPRCCRLRGPKRQARLPTATAIAWRRCVVRICMTLLARCGHWSCGVTASSTPLRVYQTGSNRAKCAASPIFDLRALDDDKAGACWPSRDFIWRSAPQKRLNSRSMTASTLSSATE